MKEETKTVQLKPQGTLSPVQTEGTLENLSCIVQLRELRFRDSPWPFQGHAAKQGGNRIENQVSQLQGTIQYNTLPPNHMQPHPIPDHCLQNTFILTWNWIAFIAWGNRKDV